MNERTGYEPEFDLSQLNLTPGVLITAETVSGGYHGEVTQVISLPANQKVRLHQPPQSGMLLTVHAQPLTRRAILPRADATCFDRPATLRVDVTQAVREAQRKDRQQLSFVLIRKQHWHDEQTNDISVVFSLRAAGLDQSPVMQVWQ